LCSRSSPPSLLLPLILCYQGNMSSSRSRSENRWNRCLPLAGEAYENAPQRVGTSSTWPLDEALVPQAPAGSPDFQRRLRNRRVPYTARGPVSLWDKRTPRSHQPSPALRAAAVSIANGAGRTAAALLKGGVQDVVAPVSPANGSEVPNRLRQRRFATEVPPSPTRVVTVKEEIERCSCCSKEEFWIVYDIFASMDRRHEDSVRRGDFLWALSTHGASVDFQRVIRRSGLSTYFKETARDISLEDFLHRIFPSATSMDILKMQRWTSLRKARNMLTSAEFSATRLEFGRVFSLLEEGCCGTIAATELLRAQILSRVEVLAVLPATVEWDLSLDDFNEHVMPHLVNRYVVEMGREHLISDVEVRAEVTQVFQTVSMKQFRFSVRRISDCPIASSDDDEAGAPNVRDAELPHVSVRPDGAADDSFIKELMKRLSASSAKQSYTSHFEVSPMCGVEHSPVVSAF